MTTQYQVSKARNAINDSQVIVFNQTINSISADRQFDLSYMGINVDDLPKQSRKLLKEKIFDKAFLNNYSRLRDRAFATLERGASVNTILGFVTSRTEAVKKIAELDAIKADWKKQIELDEGRYLEICNNRIAVIVEQAFKEGVSAEVVNKLVAAMRKRQPVWDEFKARMNFGYIVTPVTLELDKDVDGFDVVLFEAQRNGTIQLREGVFGGLVQYLVRESDAILNVLRDKKPRTGGYSINYRTVARIGEITQKLHGLSFVHQHIGPLADLIDDALKFMPEAGNSDLVMQEPQFLNLVVCLEAISDQHNLLDCLKAKKPLVEVRQIAPVVGFANNSVIGAAAISGIKETLNANQQTPAVLEETDDAETEIEAESQDEAEVTVEEPACMSFGFMGNSLFN